MSGMSARERSDRPGRGMFDGALFLELSVIKAERDPQQEAVYAWQREVLGDLRREPWLLGADEHGTVTKRAAREAAVAYLARIWAKYSPGFSPYFAGVPWLRLGFSYGGIALARKSIHSFYCDIGLLRRCVLVHEVAHLLTPRDPAHGTTFTAALLHMWELELGIAREHALVIAARLGVAVAGSEVLTNTSTNTNTVDSTGDACVASLPL